MNTNLSKKLVNSSNLYALNFVKTNLLFIIINLKIFR